MRLNKAIVTPGISAQEYADRRADFAAKLPPNSIAILRGADIKYRSGAVFHEFHQQSNFFYLTGFNEPEAIAVIQRLESSEFIFHLFVRPKDPQAELWDGARSGEQAALDVFNADEVRQRFPQYFTNNNNANIDIVWRCQPSSFTSKATY